MQFPAILLLLALLAGAALCVVLIAADPKRFFAQFSLYDWHPRQYQASLSNFLQVLHDAGLPVWPRRLNAITATFFRLRVRRIIRRRPGLRRSGFLHDHLNLAALLKILKPFIDDQILASQTQMIAGRIPTMADTSDRDRLSNFLERAQCVRIAFQKQLTPVDRQIQDHLNTIHFLAMLQRFHAIFKEHGYSLLPQLDDLLRWETMEGSELVQELPELVVPTAAPAWTGLVAQVPDSAL